MPPLTDLTAGLSLQVNDPFTQSTASVQITPTSTPTQGQVRFDATLVASRAVSITFARILQHTVAMTWTSPQPAFGRLRIEMCRTPNFPLFDIKATAIGYESTTLPFEWPSCTPPFVREYLVRVDQAGLVVQLDASGTAFGGFMSSTMLTGRWLVSLSLDPSQPCAAQPYGTSCGPTLSAQSDPRLPDRTLVRIDTTSAIAAAVMLIGIQRMNLPLPGGCFLHNEILITVPLVPQVTAASALLDPTPYPGLRVTVQGYALPVAQPMQPLSAGLELFCR